jgi:hypothetical protein
MLEVHVMKLMKLIYTSLKIANRWQPPFPLMGFCDSFHYKEYICFCIQFQYLSIYNLLLMYLAKAKPNNLNSSQSDMCDKLFAPKKGRQVTRFCVCIMWKQVAPLVWAICLPKLLLCTTPSKWRRQLVGMQQAPDLKMYTNLINLKSLGLIICSKNGSTIIH